MTSRLEKRKKALVGLCQALAPSDKKLLNEVVLAEEDPETYAKRFPARMNDRGLEGDEKNFSFIALIDGLQQRKRSASIDWKFSAEDVKYNVDRFQKPDAAHWAWYDPGDEQETKTYDFLKKVGLAFASCGQALICLNIGSDSYDLAAVPLKSVPKLKALARQLGMGSGAQVDSFSPATKPKKAPKAKPPPAPKVHKSFSIPDDFDAMDHDWESPPQGVTVWSETETDLLDFASWPPKRRLLGKGRFTGAGFSFSGESWVLDGCRRKDDRILEGTIQLFVGGAKPRELLKALPPRVEPDRWAILGSDVIVFPTEPSIRGKSCSRPLILAGKRFVEIADLPAAVPPPSKPKDFPSFVTTGVARTGSGLDVLIWDRSGWVREGSRWKRTFDVSAGDFYDDYATAPGAAESFFVSMNAGKLYEIRRGEPPLQRLTRVPGIHRLAVGPEGTVIISLVRWKKSDPAVLIFDPARRAYRSLDGHSFGLVGSDHLNDVWFSAKGARIVGRDYDTLSAVPLATALARPWLSEDTKRPVKQAV